MGRPAGTAPVTLRRFPGHSYHPESPDSSQFMALAGTWQAVAVASLYAQHIGNFRHGQARYYISGITIFSDENDKPSMVIRVSGRDPLGVRVGAVSVLDHLIRPSGSGGQRQPGPQPGPHVNGGVNGMAHGGPAAAQEHPGRQPGPHVNGGVNGNAHGGPVAAQGHPVPQPGPHVNGRVKGMAHGGPAAAQGHPGRQPGPHVNGRVNNIANGGSAATHG
jgi:hypothetical protein